MINYSLNEDDWVAFQEHHMRTSPAMGKSFKRSHYGLAGFYLLICLIFLITGEVTGAIILAIAALLWLAIYPYYYRRSLRKRAAALGREGDNANLYGPHELLVETNELVIRSRSGTMRVRTASIGRIDSTATHLFIYLSGTSAVLIPRARIDAGDIEVFERELRTAIDAAA